MTVLVSIPFIVMIPIDCKITNFSLHLCEETSMVADICRYSSRHLIPIFQTVAVAQLGIKGLLEYLQVSATTLVSFFFFYLYDPY